jgi:hypothetical protein
VHDSMRMGWGRGGGDDGGCHGRYITAAAKLMHPSMRSAYTLHSHTHTHILIYRYIFIIIYLYMLVITHIWLD